MMQLLIRAIREIRGFVPEEDLPCSVAWLRYLAWARGH
jgi:hypothetical protein